MRAACIVRRITIQFSGFRQAAGGPRRGPTTCDTQRHKRRAALELVSGTLLQSSHELTKLIKRVIILAGVGRFNIMPLTARDQEVRACFPAPPAAQPSDVKIFTSKQCVEADGFADITRAHARMCMCCAGCGLQVFGSMVNLCELEAMQISTARNDSRLSSRDTEVFELEAALELAAVDVKLSYAQAPPAFPDVVEEPEFITKAEVIAASMKQPTLARSLSVRDQEVCQDANAWMVQAATEVTTHAAVRRSGRDDEY